MTTDYATPYTHDTYTPNSSVIDEIYYDEVTETLVVVLNNGNAYAYSNVPRAVYRVFSMQEATGGSAGRYYNDFIKGYFTSLGPVDVETLEPRDQEDDEDFTLDYNEARYQEVVSRYQEVVSPEHESLNAMAPVETKQPATEVPVKSNVFTGDRNEYVVVFSDVDSDENVLTVYAENDGDALNNFEQIVTLAGWQGVNIHSVSRNFS